MFQRIHVSAMLLFAAAVWGVALMLSGLPSTGEYLRPFSVVVGSLVVALSLFDLWLWRVPVLRGWFVRRPHLWGTWRVTFQSSWVDPATGTPIGPRNGYMVVRQTY